MCEIDGRTYHRTLPTKGQAVRRICIVIASEQALLRQAVAVAFEQEEDLLVVGKAEAASQVVEAERLGPDEAAALARQSGAFEELDVVEWGEPAWTVGTSPVLAAAR